MRWWEIAAAHLDLVTPCWLCWLGSRWRHGLNQTACKIQAVELFLQVSDSLQIKAQMMEKLLSQAIPFSHIFYVIHSFIHSLSYNWSQRPCTSDEHDYACRAYAVLTHLWDLLCPEEVLRVFITKIFFLKKVIWCDIYCFPNLLHIVVLGVCHQCPVCRFGGRCYPGSGKFPVSQSVLLNA